MMNQFMEEYEVVGGKMKHALAGDNAIEKLGTLRKSLGKFSINERGDNDKDDDDGDIFIALDDDDVKDRWDCETILSERTTFSILTPSLLKS
jgi:protein LTV1